MNNFTEIEYNITAGNSNINIGEGIVNYEKMACQVVATSYNGSNSSIYIQESNNGIDWNDITDNLGNSLTITITRNGKYMLKTSIFYARFIRATIDIGDATTGIFNIGTYFKDKNV
tara:strand:- start:141 stop:488 length:348 start_codon:yes stop_codon:yes gene_type:complete